LRQFIEERRASQAREVPQPNSGPTEPIVREVLVPMLIPWREVVRQGGIPPTMQQALLEFPIQDLVPHWDLSTIRLNQLNLWPTC
jgi:hypothetical protein